MGLTCAMDHTHMGTARHGTHTHICITKGHAGHQMRAHTHRHTEKSPSTPFLLHTHTHTGQEAKQACVAIPTEELVKSSAAL